MRRGAVDDLQIDFEAVAAHLAALRDAERPVWVRHDDHYHVDFKVECRSQP